MTFASLFLCGLYGPGVQSESIAISVKSALGVILTFLSSLSFQRARGGSFSALPPTEICHPTTVSELGEMGKLLLWIKVQMSREASLFPHGEKTVI